MTLYNTLVNNSSVLIALITIHNNEKKREKTWKVESW